MKKVAGKLRLDLSQYRDLEAFAQFGSELDPETQKTLNRGERLVELLKQKEREPLEMADQVAAIYSGTGGFLDRIKTERVGEFLRDLKLHLHTEKSDLLARISETGKLEEADEEELGAAIKDFVDDFGATSTERRPDRGRRSDSQVERERGRAAPREAGAERKEP
jgi:F-type H+-transporting ATPase subunit alpha